MDPQVRLMFPTLCRGFAGEPGHMLCCANGRCKASFVLTALCAQRALCRGFAGETGHVLCCTKEQCMADLVPIALEQWCCICIAVDRNLYCALVNGRP